MILLTGLIIFSYSIMPTVENCLVTLCNPCLLYFAGDHPNEHQAINIYADYLLNLQLSQKTNSHIYLYGLRHILPYVPNPVTKSQERHLLFEVHFYAPKLIPQQIVAKPLLQYLFEYGLIYQPRMDRFS